MSFVAMTIAAQGNPAEEQSVASRGSRLIRPALGLLLPVSLALAWEIIVRLGWSINLGLSRDCVRLWILLSKSALRPIHRTAAP